MDNYINAKLNISKNLSKKTKLIYNNDDEYLNKRLEAKDNIIPFSIFENNIIKYNGSGVFQLENKNHKFKSSLFGTHNYYNILAAITIADFYKIGLTNIIDSISNFSPLPHRIEFVHSYENVDYINDSKSTTLASTIAAIECFTNIILILGGQKKGTINQTELLKCINHKNIKSIVMYGDVSQVLKDKLYTHNVVEYCDEFKKAIKKALNLSFPNSTVLLSPGFSSFDQFENYEDRGNSFKKIIMELSDVK